MDIVSIIPFKDKKKWERVKDIEANKKNIIYGEDRYKTDQLLDRPSIVKYDIKSMKSVLKEFFIDVMWKTIEKKNIKYNSVTIGFNEEEK